MNKTQEGVNIKNMSKRIDQDQIGGDHYKDMPIQVMEFCQKNRLTWGQSSVIKYTTRHEKKGGIEDLKKAMHCLKMLAWYDYGIDLDDDESSHTPKAGVTSDMKCQSSELRNRLMGYCMDDEDDA